MMTDKYGKYENEARTVRDAFFRVKRGAGLTQEKLANDMGVTQGVIGRWLNGHKRIPDAQLLKLAVILGFDPLSSRPQVKDYVDFANSVLSGADRGDLVQTIGLLTEPEEVQLRTFLDFLLSQRQL